MPKLFDEITEDNFDFWASKYYQNRQCLSIEEFNEDLARFKYVKRLLRRWKSGGDVQERLVLNHLITIHNVFGLEGGRKLCFFRMEKELWPALKTFMVYLNFLPNDEHVEVPIDTEIAEILRKI
jgi:hypothetical protein